MKLSLGIFLFLLANSAFAQSVNLGFNSTQSGRNVTLVYEKQVKQHEFSFGIGYNFNKGDYQNYGYKKSLYATTAAQRINLNFTYQRYIFDNLGCIKPFVFYDFQAKYAPSKTDFPDIFYIDSSGDRIYSENIKSFGPFAWLENNIGIGFTADITDKFYLKQKFGGGVMFILGEENQLGNKPYYSELSTLLNFSVGMRL